MRAGGYFKVFFKIALSSILDKYEQPDSVHILYHPCLYKITHSLLKTFSQNIAQEFRRIVDNNKNSAEMADIIADKCCELAPIYSRVLNEIRRVGNDFFPDLHWKSDCYQKIYQCYPA